MDQSWNKYTHVCHTCDALIEYTSTRNVTDITCECGGNTVLLSVAGATILPITDKKEEAMETTTTVPQTITLDWVENDVTKTTTYTESDIRNMVWQNKNLYSKQNEYYRKESQLRTLLEEVYADSSEQDTLAQIAEIFDVSLTKEIEVTAWVRVDMVIEVDMAEGDYDIEQLVSDNLTIDSYGSEITVNNHEIDRVEEGAY
jgi:hypothetical protein